MRFRCSWDRWGSTDAAGIPSGIAAHYLQNSMMAFVAEVSVAATGNVKARRVVCAVDCGIAVNPRNIEAQVQSAIFFASRLR